jgi:hypothetical protein
MLPNSGNYNTVCSVQGASKPVTINMHPFRVPPSFSSSRLITVFFSTMYSVCNISIWHAIVQLHRNNRLVSSHILWQKIAASVNWKNPWRTVITSGPIAIHPRSKRCVHPKKDFFKWLRGIDHSRVSACLTFPPWLKGERVGHDNNNNNNKPFQGYHQEQTISNFTTCIHIQLVYFSEGVGNMSGL